MPLRPLSEMLDDAARRGYALCYCESWSLESLQAVVGAAEEQNAPVIAGFNGGFLRHPGRPSPESLDWYASFRLALDRSPVPAAFLLNESDDVAQIEEGIRLGFTAVMLDNEGVPFDRYRAMVKQVVELAHPRAVWVEAQVGALPGAAHPGHGSPTDPDLAAEFVELTGVDALGVSAGNVHVLTQGTARLDFDIIRRVKEKVRVPLVLHGGTGLGTADIRQAIGAGISKFNFGTVLKQAFLDALREKLAAYRFPMNPHPFVGMGGGQDILAAGRMAVQAKVRELLQLTGSAGKHPLPDVRT